MLQSFVKRVFVSLILFCRPGTSAKLRMIVQHGLNTLRAGEKHGLQPAMVIHWAQCLSQMVHTHTLSGIFIYSISTLHNLHSAKYILVRPSSSSEVVG